MHQKIPLSPTHWESHLDQAEHLLKNRRNFLFSGDIDADSVSSMLALALYLRLWDKNVALVIPGHLDDNLHFLEDIIEYNGIQVLREEKEVEDARDWVEALIFCDTANTQLVPFYSLLDKNFLSQNLPVLEIDHHFGTDSEKMAKDEVTLLQEANATTELIGSLLIRLFEKNPGLPHPFSRRNIVLALLTGLLGDTIGGKVVHWREPYDHWMEVLGKNLRQTTRWRKNGGHRPGDDRDAKFGHPGEVLRYLNRITNDKQECLKWMTQMIVKDQGVGHLNLMNSTYPQVQHVCRPYNSPWFADIMGFLLNHIPEEAGKIGVVNYHGKDAEGQDCIFIKIRRSPTCSAIDLRKTENPIRRAFDGFYLGGGGHPGAVSFRVLSHDENEFLSRFQHTLDFLKKKVAS